MTVRWERLGWLCGLLVACGQPEVEPSGPAEAAAGEEAIERPDDGVVVEGLKGSLSSTEVQGALEPRMLKFATCPSKSSGMELVWGEMAFHFTVAPDGRVKDVYGTRSTLGDRETEACMLRVARGAKFPRPHGGGEAEFSWSLEIPPDPEVRAPVELSPEAAAEALAESAASLVESCGGGSYTATAYIDTDGSVMEVGVIDPRSGVEEALDCIAAGLEGWTFSEPGSYPGKVTFSFP